MTDLNKDGVGYRPGGGRGRGSERSGEHLLAASRIRAEAERGRSVLPSDPLPAGLSEADQTEAAILAPLPLHTVEIGAGGEMVPADEGLEESLALIDTLAQPNIVNADASRMRLELAQAVGGLELALDTA